MNPGSHEAIKAGCKCPRSDNNNGRGMYTNKQGEKIFVYSADCPLHGNAIVHTLFKATGHSK
jgi:hypothetical protein